MLGAAPALLTLAIASPPLELAATVRAEALAGSSPTGPGGAPEGRADFELTPWLSAGVEGREDTFLLRYGPRVYVRLGEASAAPLVLHQLEGTGRASIGHLLSLDLRAAARIGDIDYTSASIGTPGLTPGTVPAADRLRTVSGDGAVGTEVRIDRWWRGRLELRGGYDAPEGDLAGLAFPRQIRGGGSVAAFHRASSRDELSAEVLMDVVDFDPGTQFDSLGVRAGWRRAVSRTLDLELRVGGLVIAASEGDTTVSPLCDVALAARVLRDGDATFGVRAAVALDGYADPIRARYEPRGSVTLGLTGAIGRDLAMELTASLYTLLTSAPPEADLLGALGALAVVDPRFTGAIVVPDDTFLSVRAPVTWRVDPDTTLEAGARFFARGPHLAADDFDFRQVGLLFYVAGTFTASTD